MKTAVTILVIFATGFVGVLLATHYNWFGKVTYSNGNVACTAEAKLCPDGSYVGRVGPKCEFAACPVATSTSGGGTGIVPFNSGVHGALTVGPTCPVERIPPEPQCAPKPFSTLVAIFRASDPVHAYVLTRSDSLGKFSASLAPGSYIIGAGESMLPRCQQAPLTVLPDKYTEISITCDSGIR